MRQSKIDAFTRLIKSFSPQGVLERGYSIIRKQNKIISSANDLRSGDDIEIKLSDGSVGAEVL